MKALALVPLVLLAAACGSSGSPAPGGAPVSGKHGPPAAWLETKSGHTWLGFSSWCWRGGRTGVCADAAQPTCGQESVPNIHVERGETVRAHLGYSPDEVSVSGGLTALHGRVVTWQINAAGPFYLFTKGPRGDASYAGCAIFG